jgi:ubiquinol-cytochrome c reductase cytochrome c subunit
MRKNTRTPRPTGRRSPLASVALLVLGLLTTGGTYALFTTTAAAETTEASQQMVAEGEKLFASNCASCHGLSAEGSDVAPTLIGVGAASVDFQVGTGRMPLAAQGPQGEEKPVQFNQTQIDQLAAFVASLAPGPSVPDDALLQADGDATNGAELFRINCAMCHNVAGAGGALTEGKWAPSVQDVSGKHIYEAMISGPSNMPVFNDLNLTPEDKRDIITYLVNYASATSPGGIDLGDLGPVAEGLFLWIFGLGAIVGITIWLTAKSN